MNTRRSRLWVGGVLLGLGLLIGVAASVLDWNSLRDPLARWVTRSTGRSFAINGDLSVKLALRPRIVANDIVVGNAAWGRDPDLATIKRVDFRIDLLKLLVGSVEFPQVALSDAHLALEVGKDGTPNWVFNGQSTNKALEFPSIGALSIDRGSAKYHDPAVRTELVFDVKTVEPGRDDPESTLEVAAKGRFKGLPTILRARGGGLLSLRNPDKPYPVKASATLGETKASIDGMLLDPLHLKGEQLNLKLEGGDLAQLYPIIGVPIPPTAAYTLAGFLDHSGDVWTFRRFNGTVGQSDLAGEFAVDRSQHPQKITAGLVSRKLYIKDLGGFIGADRGTRPSQTPPPAGRVLPAEPFSLEKVQAADVDVHFRGEQIFTESMPLENMTAHLVVNSGVVKLAPLDFGIAGGKLVSQIEMDGRKPRIATRADITAKGLHLGQMFPASRLAAADTGTVGGRARLDGNGNSVAQMLGSANGEAALIMDGGTVSELMLRLSNLDIANALARMLGGDKQVPIRCLVGNFKAVDGDFKVEALVLDTPKVNITGSGDANFTDESLHLRLVSRSKDFSLASLRGPVVIGGSFNTPSVRPELGSVMVRSGIAVGLGALTSGIGALIPLLQFGKREDSNCTALVNQAKSDAGVKERDISVRADSRPGVR